MKGQVHNDNILDKLLKFVIVFLRDLIHRYITCDFAFRLQRVGLYFLRQKCIKDYTVRHTFVIVLYS